MASTADPPDGPFRSPPAADRHGEAWYAGARALARDLARSPGRGAARARLASRLPVLDARQEAFAAAVFDAHPGTPVRCAPGCSASCHQWVEGVFTHEIERLGAHVRAHLDPAEVLAALEASVAAHAAVEPDPGAADEGEGRAVAYLALRRPCVFLDGAGRCAVHPLRPQACRGFFSVSDPLHCTAEYVLGEGNRAFYLEPHERTAEALAALDARFPLPGATGALVPDLAAWLRRAP